MAGGRTRRMPTATSVDDVIRGMQSVADLSSASEHLLDQIATIAGVARRLRAAERKAKNSGPVMRAFWQAIADRRRARLDRLNADVANAVHGA